MLHTPVQQMMLQAQMLVDAGKLQDAKKLYQQICHMDQRLAEAWLMLGAINGELGDVTGAITCLQTAVYLQPENADAHLTLAHVLCVDGKLSEAHDHCQRATQASPDHEQAWLLLSGINGQMGSFPEAETCARKTLELWPDCTQALFNLGIALSAQRRPEEAAQVLAQATELEPSRHDAWLLLAALKLQLKDVPGAETCYRAALAQAPDAYTAWDGLGLACQARGEFSEALRHHKKALMSNHDFTDAHLHMGDAHRSMGSQQQAMESYQNALKCNPALAEAYNRIGNLLAESGDLEAAQNAYQSALHLRPDHAAIHFNLGNLLNVKGKFDQARYHHEEAVKSDPHFVDAYTALGDLLQEEGNLNAARACYRKAITLNDSSAIKVKLATTWPVILESKEQIEKIRDEFIVAIDDLMTQPLSVSDPATEICRTVFYPVYSGLNDLELQLKIAQLYEKISPDLLYTAPHCQQYAHQTAGAKRIALGIISRFLYTHTMGSVMKGLIEHLSRNLFEITIFTFPYPSDKLAHDINACADRVVMLPKDWKSAHQLVAQEKMDILFYTDIGMDPYTYFLAYARLAPVQCTTWGHAVTTGLTNMDYYITCNDFEPAGADDHYSEKLVRLNSPPTYYYRPQLQNTTKSRKDYGWSADKNLYLCPQTLYKLHPDFDEMIAGILREDPVGQVVLVDCRHQQWVDLLLARFKKTMPDVVDRIVVLPYPGSSEYLDLLNMCDVMLDTYHYGGGSTSLQGLAFGTPIVTLPGNFQRGRHTYCYYKKMDYMECVAIDPTEYIQIAVRLGTDATYRQHVREQILARNPVLYENMQVVREIEQFFVKAARDS